MIIKKISIVGTGLMGLGMGQAIAQHGMTVNIKGRTVEAIERNMGRVRRNLQGQVEKERMTSDEMNEVLVRMKTTTVWEDIVDADLVIEVVAEDMALKKETFAHLDKICSPQTILATGTTILSPTEIGSAAERRDKTIGMHWFNPAPVMKLVEVTAGLETSEETIEAVMEFARSIGKTPVRVNEAPGGIVSRILNAMRNVAIDIFAEGVASAEDIDTAMKLGANWPMGPLELTDLTGVDLQLINSENLVRELGSAKYQANPLLRKMVRAGHFGRKSGRGFYDYTKKE